MAEVAFGAFRLDVAGRRLRRDGQPVTLPAKAFDMLVVLVERPGRVVRKDELLDRLWPDSVVEEANVSVTMSALRKALGESAGDLRYVATVPGVGYKFVAPVTPVTAAPPDAAAGPSRTETPPPSGREASPRQPRRLALAAAGVATASLLVVLAWRELTSDAAPTGRRVVPLTSSPGHKMLPAFSPDGAQVAFAWRGERGDNADVYVKQIEAEGLLRLTDDPAPDSNPVWSPDGRHLAFSRAHSDGDAIYIVPSIGGPERKVAAAAGGQSLQNLAWSPDGKSLAFGSRPSRGIELLALAGGERRRLTKPPEARLHDGSPQFSPDGKLVAFVRGSSFFAGDVYLTPAAGGEVRRLTFDNRWLMGIAWTADGRDVVFSSNRSGLPALWRVAAAGGEPRPMEAGSEDAMFPAVSRRGQRLAYVRWKSDSNIWRFPGPQAPTSADPAAKLIASSRDDSLPQFSPDGRRIAFESNRSGSQEIWLADSDGRNQVQLTSLRGAPGGTPRWSPDGARIAFDWRPEGHADVYVIGLVGGALQRLTSELAEDLVPSWSRDGRWIYFASNRSGRDEVWKVPSRGGEAVRVTRQGGFEAFESPDRRTLYFHRDNAIWALPLAGGRETQVAGGVEWGYWAITGDSLCYLDRRPRPRHEIVCVDAATRQPRTIATLEEDLAVLSAPGFAVSPDGRSILVKRVDQGDYDLMLVEAFR